MLYSKCQMPYSHFIAIVFSDLFKICLNKLLSSYLVDYLKYTDKYWGYRL